MKTDFSPTLQHLNAVENLLCAMALHQITKEAFEKYETQILESGYYRYGALIPNRIKETEGDRVFNRKHIHLIEGIKEYGTDDYAGTDAARFFSELDRLAKNAGFINGQNAECMLSNQVTKLETKLLAVTADLHELNPEDIPYHFRKEILDMLLKLLTRFVSKKEIGIKQLALYAEHVAVDKNLSNALKIIEL